VAATSASDAWTVGYSGNSASHLRTLAEHWNGTKWALVPTQNPGAGGNTFNYMESVAATSASHAWAVGAYNPGSQEQTFRTLAFHCC
jgi:hypothetical protein